MSNTTITTAADQAHAEKLANARATLAQRQEAEQSAQDALEALWGGVDSGDDTVSAQSLSNAQIDVERSQRLTAAAQRELTRLTRLTPGQSWVSELVAEVLTEALGISFEAGTAPKLSELDEAELPRAYVGIKNAVKGSHAGYASDANLSVTVLRSRLHRTLDERELQEALEATPRLSLVEVTAPARQGEQRDSYTVKARRVWPELPKIAKLGKFLGGPNLGPVQESLYLSQFSTHMANVAVTRSKRYDGQPNAPKIDMGEPVQHQDGRQTITATYEVAVNVKQPYAEFGNSALERTVAALEDQVGDYEPSLGRCIDVQTRVEPFASGRLGHSVHVAQTWESAA